jgi:hypothetical protein
LKGQLLPESTGPMNLLEADPRQRAESQIRTNDPKASMTNCWKQKIVTIINWTTSSETIT